MWEFRGYARIKIDLDTNRMPFSIKNPEADRLARELTSVTGESLTAAVTAALRERLERLTGPERGRSLADELDEIAQRCAALPMLKLRPADEILGYGDDGLPR